MNIEYRLTIKDHLEANHAHFKSQTSLYYTIWGISLFCIIVGFLCLISGFILTPAELMKKSFFLVLGSILVTLGVFSNPSFNPLRRSEIIRACESQPSIRESRTLEVTEEKLTIKSPSFHSTIDWQSYSHFIETKNLFILYQARQVFYLFPKRAFSSNDQISKFRELLHTKIGKSRSI